jgi:hypothetical protein
MIGIRYTVNACAELYRTMHIARYRMYWTVQNRMQQQYRAVLRTVKKNFVKSYAHFKESVNCHYTGWVSFSRKMYSS